MLNTTSQEFPCISLFLNILIISKNGIKVSPDLTNPYLAVTVSTMDVGSYSVYHLTIGITRVLFDDGVADGYTGVVGSTKYLGSVLSFDGFRETFNEALDEFLLNYIESNME